MMKTTGLALLALLAAAPAFAAPVLEGRAEQGGLLVGQTDPAAQVHLDGKPVTVGPDGRFLLGFARDAAPQAVLEITPPGQPPERVELTIAKRDWDIQRIDGLPQSQVTPDPELLKRIRAESALVAKARAQSVDTAYWQEGFAQPAEGRRSGVFGSQRILNGEPRAPHSGVDIAAPTGTPVLAAAPGVVMMAHPDLFYTGMTVLIDHGQGLNSVYAHLSEITVTEGQHVARGEVIGAIGATGRATGPHLHWGVTLGDVRLDPETVLDVLPVVGQ
ncbi:M23 family metallopeptidase [Telmatospirillum sp. J64-1]|uniref:M23 family metallopeptidase n=1 Tax=Telmatospirillum sp. J64-1 TaxID=2502183 RepID=UPI00115F63C9|nr:M23 family metallopeptidase [Telmatospirillum sp. J64-1]